MPSSSSSTPAGRTSALHGVLVILFGCLAGGVIHEIALIDGGHAHGPGNKSDATRVAHAGAISNGLLSLSFGAAVATGALRAPRGAETAVATAAWLNAVAYTIGAVIGHRGLGPVCFSTTPPYLVCTDERFLVPGSLIVNAMFIVAAGLAVFGLASSAWCSASCASSTATNTRTAATPAGALSTLRWVLTGLAALTIPSVIAHLFLDHDLHEQLAGIVFGEREVKIQFPKYKHPNNRLLVFMHMICGAGWMLLALWQITPRSRTSGTHKSTGYMALFAALGSLVGLTIFTTGVAHSVSERFGAAFFGIMWAIFLAKGYTAARAGDFGTHAKWMVRATCVSFGVGTIRLLYAPVVLSGTLQKLDLATSREVFGGIFWVAVSLTAIMGEVFVQCKMTQGKAKAK